MTSNLLHVTLPHSAWEAPLPLRLHASPQLLQVDIALLVAYNTLEHATLAKVQKNHGSTGVFAGKGETWRLPSPASHLQRDYCQCQSRSATS